MKFEIETDARGGKWILAPHERMMGSLADMLDLTLGKGNRSLLAGTFVGIRHRVPPGIGSGQWDVLRLSPHLYLLLGDLEYHHDQEIMVPSDYMAKVRILLSGGLRQVSGDVRLEGAGAFVESYPGSQASSYVLRGGELTRMMILNCEREFFSHELGLSPDELPFPLSYLFEQAERPEGSVAPLGPDVLRAANDVMRAGSRFEPRLLIPYLAAKGREIACAMIADLAAARENPWLQVRSSVRDVSRINEARDILLDEFQRPPSIPKLARRVGVNQTKLKALFKATFGLTIHEFTQRCRMERAVDLLASTDLSVAEIAYAVGYDYPASFTHAFRKFHGHAPRQARRASEIVDLAAALDR